MKPELDKIICGDNVEVMSGFDDCIFDTCVTSPYYGIIWSWQKIVDNSRRVSIGDRSKISGIGIGYISSTLQGNVARRILLINSELQKGQFSFGCESTKYLAEPCRRYEKQSIGDYQARSMGCSEEPEIKTRAGSAELPLNVRHFIQVRNGQMQAKSYGGAIRESANVVEKRKMDERCTFITSSLFLSKNYEPTQRI